MTEDRNVHAVSIVLVSRDNHSMYIHEWRYDKIEDVDKLQLHLVGGKVEEKDGNSLNTAFREFREEIGIDLTQYRDQMIEVKVNDYPLTGRFYGKVNRVYYFYVDMYHKDILYLENNRLKCFGRNIRPTSMGDERVVGVVWIDNVFDLDYVKQHYETTFMFDNVYKDRYNNPDWVPFDESSNNEDENLGF